MSHSLPDDWYIEPTGESRILDQRKVVAEIEHLRTENENLQANMSLRDKYLVETDQFSPGFVKWLECAPDAIALRAKLREYDEQSDRRM